MTHYAKVEEKDILDQGDILYPIKIKELLPWWPDDKEFPIVIMTPTCDIIQDKADYHRFCILQPFPYMLYHVMKIVNLTNDQCKGEESIGKGKKDKILVKLTNAIRNSWPRYHFLPKDNKIFETDRFIDFEVIGTVPTDNFNKSMRIGRLTSPYKEELLHRFSHHVMRIGTPDHSEAVTDRIIKEVLGSANLVFG